MFFTNRLPFLLTFVLIVMLVLSGSQPAAASQPPNLAALSAKVQAAGSVRVIVLLDTPFQPAGVLANADSANAQAASLDRAQTDLLARLPGLDAHSVKKFSIIPGLALQVDAAGLAALAADPAVTHIEEDLPEPAELLHSVPLIGAPTAWAAGATGAGQTVAILDTGVDKNHPFLTGKVVSEACFSSNNTTDGTTSLCPGAAASSTAVDSALPYGTVCPSGACDHGTHVAGIAAGKDPGGLGFSGVAKDATIIAIQVFSATAASVVSYPSDQILGLQRVLALKNSFAISAVNMSLGSGKYTDPASCNTAQAARKAAIDNLRSAGIATVISAGNGYSSTSPIGVGLSAPGCISTAVSVGSTTDGTPASSAAVADMVSSFSQTASFLSLLAPGQLITSSIPGGAYANMQGTSMAAPHVTGAWAVMRSKFPSASVDQILNALVTTGLPVTDTRMVPNLIKPRIRLDQAAATYNISGKVTTDGSNAAAGVTLSDGQGHSAVSAADGSYTLSTLMAGNYTITPTKAGLTFNPANIAITLTANQTNANFSAVGFSIAGRITLAGGFAVAGVSVSAGSGYTATSDALGNYTIGGLPAGAYDVTPSKTLYTFAPVKQTLSLGPSRTGIDFTGSTTLYSVSGKVTISGPAGLAGVLISDGLGRTTTTIADGSYTLNGLPPGDYTLFPLKVGYATTPFKLPVTITNANKTGQNFSAAPGGHFTFLPLTRK